MQKAGSVSLESSGHFVKNITLLNNKGEAIEHSYLANPGQNAVQTLYTEGAKCRDVINDVQECLKLDDNKGLKSRVLHCKFLKNSKDAKFIQVKELLYQTYLVPKCTKFHITDFNLTI